MEEYFKCLNCKELIRECFESECCGDLYCSKCVVTLVTTPCTKCKKDLHFSKNSFAERFVKLIKVSCKFNCGKKFSYEEMRTHLLNCEKKIFECSFPKCEFKGKKDEMHRHIIQAHYTYLLIMMENYNSFEKTIEEIEKGNDKGDTCDKDDETLVYFANSSFGNDDRNSMMYINPILRDANIYRRDEYDNYFMNNDEYNEVTNEHLYYTDESNYS